MTAASYERLTVGSTVEWYTPPEIFDALGLTFDLDPCAPPGGLPWIPTARSLSRAEDGLTQPWQGRIWLNPPYGRGIDRWMAKLSAHGDGIALVHSRTDTAWWRAAVASATAICFIAGRVRFINAKRDRPPGASPAPSVLLAYGQVCAIALIESRLGPSLLIPGDLRPTREVVA